MSDSIYELAREHPATKSAYSSMTSVVAKKSSYNSSCRICLSSIHDPACLTCGHKFCEICLEKYWDAKDRPDFIVCPLCRTNAFNVDFTQKDSTAADVTHDFRKTFNILENISESDEVNSPTSCFKFSILVPALYYLLKWLRLPIIELLTFLHVSFSSRM